MTKQNTRKIWAGLAVLAAVVSIWTGPVLAFSVLGLGYVFCWQYRVVKALPPFSIEELESENCGVKCTPFFKKTYAWLVFWIPLIILGGVYGQLILWYALPNHGQTWFAWNKPIVDIMRPLMAIISRHEADLPATRGWIVLQAYGLMGFWAWGLAFITLMVGFLTTTKDKNYTYFKQNKERKLVILCGMLVGIPFLISCYNSFNYLTSIKRNLISMRGVGGGVLDNDFSLIGLMLWCMLPNILALFLVETYKLVVLTKRQIAAGSMTLRGILLQKRKWR